jgi:hypothetical protein
MDSSGSQQYSIERVVAMWRAYSREPLAGLSGPS